ncbi:MAG: tellurite resistance TerB family protein [Ignavibacterium sp.]|uniref:tellurite resistance TerB family protein n=1 Tax=Ignavibacterium sp. TaxID=2651167 RepID=UPI00404A24AC
MLSVLRKFLFEEDEQTSESVAQHNHDVEKKLQVAACALFIELAKADGNFTDEEKTFIINHMKNCFSIDDEYVKELIELAEKRVKESVSIYEFTGEINEHFTQEQKEKLIENLWRLVFTDEKMHAYEDHLMKKVSLTLNIEHKKLIEKKLLVKSELGLK